nr:hypothetical protein BaRGS_000113 [Batillaria attramentaria]
MAAPLKPKRPEVTQSAVVLKSKYNVQHRSDLLMKEHLSNVRSSQEALKVALAGIERAKTKSEVERWAITAGELKEKTEHLVLVLQVMNKLNIELAYARADLNDALYKGMGDINAARKRVIWLEDKMGELCGKKRLKSRPVNRLNRDYDSESDSDDNRPLDSAQRMNMGERERTRSLAQILGSDFGGFTSTDTETNRSGGRHQEILTSSDSHGNKPAEDSEEFRPDYASDPHEIPKLLRRSIHRYRSPNSPQEGMDGEKERLPEHRHLYASMTTLTSGQEDIAEESSGDTSPVKEVSVPDTSEPSQSERTDDEEAEESEDSPKPWLQEHRIPGTASSDDASQSSQEGGEEEGEEEEETEEDGGETPKGGVNFYIEGETPKTPQSRDRDFDDEKGEEDEDEEGSESGKDSEEETDEEEGEGEEGQVEGGDQNKTFITEIGVTRKRSSAGKQHVQIESPPKEETKEEEAKTETPDDIGAAYWQSEHHRFEYSNFSGTFQSDPLSYHRVGLAVPGSFLKRSMTDFNDLPWMTKLTAKDIKDIHREALDKLAMKLHSMQDKIFDATMLSVRRRPLPSDGPPEASFLQNIDRTVAEAPPHPGLPVKSKSMPVTSTAQRGRAATQDSLPTSRPHRQSTTSTPARLVFYPKPIPPPQVLPITRTNLNKEFPQFASSFAEPDPDQRPPAERIVDQRNLIEETKLVLYHQKPKPESPGPSSMERRLQKMIERDRIQSQNKSSADALDAQYYRKKLRSQFKMAAALTSMQTAVTGWKQIKPKSRGKEYAGLRWERVKTIVHRNLNSDRAEERIDAAKQLGLLRCGDTMVFYALKERLHRDSDHRVRYEAAKALILIGCWEDEVMRMVLKYLVLGNTEIRIDLINTLIEGKNVQYVDKTIPTFIELVKVLSHFCCNPDPEDQIAFESAVLLGRLCVRDANAEARLVKAVEEPTDTHMKAKALEILVKQLVKIDEMIVDQILNLMAKSPVWRYRVVATKLLIALGPKQKFVVEKQDEIYNMLSRCLWDDPSNEVRLSAAKALTALGMFARACESVENRLEAPDENTRAEAVISVGTLGMKNERVIRLLLEMLELDASEYVRLMIIRTFGTLKLTDRRILRTLREREKLDGPLASGNSL